MYKRTSVHTRRHRRTHTHTHTRTRTHTHRRQSEVSHPWGPTVLNRCVLHSRILRGSSHCAIALANMATACGCSNCLVCLKFVAFVLRDLVVVVALPCVTPVRLFVLYLRRGVVALPTCSTSPPSGNLVDGLQLVAHTGADGVGARAGR